MDNILYNYTGYEDFIQYVFTLTALYLTAIIVIVICVVVVALLYEWIKEW